MVPSAAGLPGLKNKNKNYILYQMVPYFTTDEDEDEWRKDLVREMERELRKDRPILFTDKLENKLEVRKE